MREARRSSVYEEIENHILEASLLERLYSGIAKMRRLVGLRAVADVVRKSGCTLSSVRGLPSPAGHVNNSAARDAD